MLKTENLRKEDANRFRIGLKTLTMHVFREAVTSSLIIVNLCAGEHTKAKKIITSTLRDVARQSQIKFLRIAKQKTNTYSTAK